MSMISLADLKVGDWLIMSCENCARQVIQIHRRIDVVTIFAHELPPIYMLEPDRQIVSILVADNGR